MKEHESVLVFAKKKHKYYPIKEPRKGSGAKRLQYGHSGSKTGEAWALRRFRGSTPRHMTGNHETLQVYSFLTTERQGIGVITPHKSLWP